MSGQVIVVCKEIRRVPGGYIVHIRWPYGPEVSGHGEVICPTFADVVKLLRDAALESEGAPPT